MQQRVHPRASKHLQQVKDAAKSAAEDAKTLIIKELKPKTKLLFPLPTDLPTPGEKLDLDTQDPTSSLEITEITNCSKLFRLTWLFRCNYNVLKGRRLLMLERQVSL